MAVKLPKYPSSPTLDKLKKVKVSHKEFTAEGEWKVSFDKAKTLLQSTKELKSAYDKISLKPFTELEAAIKSGEDVIARYQALGNEFTKVDAYKGLATNFKKAADKKAKVFKGDKVYKKLGEWYGSIGSDVMSNAEEIEKIGDDLLAAAEKVDTGKVSDLKWDLNDWDLHNVLRKDYKLKLKYDANNDLNKPYKVLVSVTGKVGSEAANNATLRAEFFEAAFDAGKSCARTLAADLTKIDAAIDSGKVAPDKGAKLVEAAYGNFNKAYGKEADKGIQGKWNEFTKDKKDYKSYKIKTFFKITGKAIGLGVGIAATAAGGWTGVGTVMGAAAALKNAAELFNACKDAYQEAKKVKENIDKDLKTLQDRFKEAGKASAKETGGQALEALTGIRTTTVKSVKGNIGLFGDKLKGCHSNAVKAGGKIDVAIKEINGLKGKLSRARKDLSSSPKAIKSIAALEKQIAKFETALNNLLTKGTAAASDYREGKESIKEYLTTIKKLEGDIHAAAKFFNTWGMPFLKFAFVSDAPGAITTAGSVTRDLISEATKTTDELEELNAAGDLAGDITSLVTGLMG